MGRSSGVESYGKLDHETQMKKVLIVLAVALALTGGVTAVSVVIRLPIEWAACGDAHDGDDPSECTGPSAADTDKVRLSWGTCRT
jgi:hypothetical protein